MKLTDAIETIYRRAEQHANAAERARNRGWTNACRRENEKATELREIVALLRRVEELQKPELLGD